MESVKKGEGSRETRDGDWGVEVEVEVEARTGEWARRKRQGRRTRRRGASHQQYIIHVHLPYT
jgi:hypothetical protein